LPIWLQVLSAQIELGSGQDVQSQIAALNKLRRTVVRKRDPHAMEARVHNPMDREKGIAYAAVRNETIGLYRTLRVLPSPPPSYTRTRTHTHARQSSARPSVCLATMCGRAVVQQLGSGGRARTRLVGAVRA
jgi:hypothetical protein